MKGENKNLLRQIMEEELFIHADIVGNILQISNRAQVSPRLGYIGWKEILSLGRDTGKIMDSGLVSTSAIIRQTQPLLRVDERCRSQNKLYYNTKYLCIEVNRR